MIKLSCGHEIHDIDYACDASIKDYDDYGRRTVSHVYYCEGCYFYAMDKGIVLMDGDEEARWLTNFEDAEVKYNNGNGALLYNKREATAKGKQHAKHGLHKGKKR